MFIRDQHQDLISSFINIVDKQVKNLHMPVGHGNLDGGAIDW